MPSIDALSPFWAVIGLLQAIFLLLLAPLMSGISRQIRARMQSRRGAGIFQDYRDIIKLFSRQEMSPANAGIIFRVTPLILIGTMLLVAMIIPIMAYDSLMSMVGDLIVIIYLFALFRFFFSLSGIDSGSPFAGLGASRELMLGILVEPILILGLIVIALIAGSTNISFMGIKFISQWGGATPTAAILAMLACAFAVFIEMGKIPFDYAEAEQELQEGPLSEYSGVGFALIKLSISLKQVVFASLFIVVFIPFSPDNYLLAILCYLVKLVIVFVLASIFENCLCRGRFLLTSNVTWAGFGISVLAYVFYLTGL
ncbi:hydrogenase 3 membrane subunit [Gilliamella sp. wkB108]|uniref:respiratory chain complex I subunit 1 family protein n=1 Tax=Gilliamella sp. wkB108 TaxID=3120256 RepID=UPI00080D9203|nr:respiratory chain complex I subunit 1 family protein [Gilliamella apicola]OCG26028.1 hydrogenase 3 membrane subunit [Gilliamella apicola]